MTDLMTIKQSAKVTVDEQGNPIVQIPLEVWEEFWHEQNPKSEISAQNQRLLALLEQWQNEPDDQSEEWWDEFQQFLRENRVNFPYTDLGLGDDE
ncbi:MAG: hypothetical protein DPW16_17480 [Chloroflexi bacterium]|nr:hypothetical protein [Chloroflexota bacterium]